MTKKMAKLEVSKDADEAHEIASAKALGKALEIDANALLNRKLNEIGSLLWHHEGESVAEMQARLVRAVELYESLVPADGAEGMLALQMVGTHDAALECLRRAALSNQSFAGRDMALKHAHKLMTLYTQQLAALNKHRGKGQQKVTVEHVNVEAGGQAIVGNVEADRAGKQRTDARSAISDAPSIPLTETRSKKKARMKGRPD